MPTTDHPSIDDDGAEPLPAAALSRPLDAGLGPA
jgi:hypothetical protein